MTNSKNKKPPRAMILAAGKGTRLLPLTATTPKPLLKIAGEPLIGHQIKALHRAGVTEIVVNLHHLGEQIEEYLGDGSRFGVSIAYSREDELLETGGGIRQALPLLGDQPFWLLNGDIYTDFDFADLPTAPSGDSKAHIVLTPTPAYRERGDFEFADGVVSARGEAYVYCCIAVLDATLFDAALPQVFSLRDIYFDLLTRGELSAQVFTGLWQDIGSLEQYQQARDLAEA